MFLSRKQKISKKQTWDITWSWLPRYEIDIQWGMGVQSGDLREV
jgi:hypothetical protein